MARALFDKPEWAAGALVIAAIVNVPIFLACLFLLQTRFRPEMQEDTYYAKYLERRSEITGKVERVRISNPAPRKLKLDLPFIRPGSLEVITDPSAPRIEINDLLPNYKTIRKALEDAGLKIFSTFGSTSQLAPDDPTPQTQPPNNRVLSFGMGTDIPMLQTALKVAATHGIHGIAASYKTELPERGIYIGAYSYDEGENPFTPLDDQLLKKLLDPDLNERTLTALVPPHLELP